MPFYLHLAVDSQQRADGSMGGALVSEDEILARFLQHVAPEEVRTLDVLAPARIFDYEIFRRLTAAFDLPASRLAWDSLISYSFVYPAGDGQRLHQLIRVAITDRLPAATLAQIHAALGGLWEDRARQASGPAAARAYREAAYHGLHAGPISAPGLLRYADLAVRQGGHGAAGGIAQDLEEWLAGQPGGNADAGLALRCLRAEAAVRLGDTAAITELTSDIGAATAETGDPVTARLAVAAGNGQRIAGNTGAALAIFTRVWDLADGPPKLTAGLWASDLLMCQGNFRDAEKLAAELEALIPEDDAELRGDVARMRHLSRRFGFDYAAARRYLEAAASFYQTADSVLGLANIGTNRAELLALTNPAEAIAEAARAIETQREIGAHHETGKAYTALGIAHLRLGELDRAEAALRSAFDSLDRAGYRSGRARAELYLAAVHGRGGRLDEALVSLRLAVAELEAADVYPTLIACAARMLAILGLTDDGITSSADRAANRIQPLGTTAELDTGITGLGTDLLGAESIPPPDDLYREAAARAGSEPGLSGFYNHNVKVVTRTGPVIVRMPIPGSDLMDLSIWLEADVLRAIRGTVSHAPRLLYAADKPRFLAMEFIEGDLLDDVAPRGVPVPDHVIGDVADVLAQLASIRQESVPPLPEGWPGDGQSGEFARRLSAITADVYSGFRPEFGALFTALGIPGDPLAAVLERWTTLTARPFRLLHTDIHRKNMVISGGQTYFIDWQLALWGDPVYDLAVHIHKMGYSPAEHHAMRAAWLAAFPGRESDGWEADLSTYLSHERVKSAIVDTVRYAKLITAGTGTAGGDAELAGKLAAKLGAAYATGGTWPDREAPAAEEILGLIRRWSQPRLPRSLSKSSESCSLPFGLAWAAPFFRSPDKRHREP